MQLTEIRDRLRHIRSILRRYWASTDAVEMTELYAELDAQIAALYEDVQDAVEK